MELKETFWLPLYRFSDSRLKRHLIILYGLDVSEGLIRNQLQINSTNKLPKCLRCQISSLDNLDGKET